MKIETTVTRRNLLAMPAAAAIMAPAVAAPVGNDAELLRLGQRLMPLVAEIAAARGVPQDDFFWGERLGEAVALLEEIIALQPTTMEGFAVQLLAVTTANDDIFDEGGGLELPFGVAAFFRNACKFAGVPMPA